MYTHLSYAHCHVVVGSAAVPAGVVQQTKTLSYEKKKENKGVGPEKSGCRLEVEVCRV